ncbi:hypothetical protein [Paraburkholderia sp. UCT2]|uniref:hypothetical protein n=1 Tax=Paraburkholderia sp. UCT2 TaxID=2615208 RepID=UPI0016560227|nr:hypothetical protein [Paraburkholderia sp. UCT2]MBC8732298.1 hypothetical protein [Paraburkholderia sp. UCT2]
MNDTAVTRAQPRAFGLLTLLARLAGCFKPLLMTVQLVKEPALLAVLPLTGQDDRGADLQQPVFQFSVFAVAPEQALFGFISCQWVTSTSMAIGSSFGS